MPINDARDLTMRELRVLRDTLRSSGWKSLADYSDLLLISVVDAGLGWSRWLPEVEHLKHEARASLSGKRSLPQR